MFLFCHKNSKVYSRIFSSFCWCTCFNGLCLSDSTLFLEFSSKGSTTIEKLYGDFGDLRLEQNFISDFMRYDLNMWLSSVVPFLLFYGLRDLILSLRRSFAFTPLGPIGTCLGMFAIDLAFSVLLSPVFLVNGTH